MNQEDYCSYELAMKLKECGFDEPCNYGYSVKMRLEPEVSFGEPKTVHSKDPKNYNDNRKGIEKGLSFCSAPHIYHAQKWLREKHDIHIQIEAVMQKQWTYTLVDTAPLSDMYGEWHDRIPEDREGYPQISTYEQALSDGIASALELIKKGE